MHCVGMQVSESVTFPIDAVKTRMQFSKGGDATFANVLVRTVKVDGVGALYRSLERPSPLLVWSLCFCTAVEVMALAAHVHSFAGCGVAFRTSCDRACRGQSRNRTGWVQFRLTNKHGNLWLVLKCVRVRACVAIPP